MSSTLGEKTSVLDIFFCLAGVSRQTIGSIESGQYCTTAMLALILTKCLRKKFEELFYMEDDKDDK